jgi:hypothetical protein
VIGKAGFLSPNAALRIKDCGYSDKGVWDGSVVDESIVYVD